MSLLLTELNSKLNVRKYKSAEAVAKAVDEILKENQTERFFKIDISTNEASATTKSETSNNSNTNKQPHLTWSRNLQELKNEKMLMVFFRFCLLTEI